MPIYEVRPGFTHGAHNQHTGGDRVELTAQEAAGFRDKLRLVEPVDEAQVQAVGPASTEAGEPPAPKPAVLPAETGGGAAPSLPVAPGHSEAVEEAAVEWPGGLSNALVRLLRQNGFTDPEAVQAASDEDLLAVDGLGAKALDRIREAFRGEAA